jgi:GGDEF domain-containing protein
MDDSRKCQTSTVSPAEPGGTPDGIRDETQIGGFLSISIGIASYAFPEAGSPTVLIGASDRALYKAKQSGRNRIERVSMQMPGEPSISH